MISQDTLNLVFHWAPWIILGVIALKSLDKAADRFRAACIKISKGAGELGLTDTVEPLFSALGAGDNETAKAIAEQAATKFGSEDGIMEAACEVIEKTGSKLMTIDKYKTRVETALLDDLLGGVITPELKKSAFTISTIASQRGLDHLAAIASGIATGDIDNVVSQVRTLETLILAPNGVDNILMSVFQKAIPALKANPQLYPQLLQIWNSTAAPALTAAAANAVPVMVDAAKLAALTV